MYSTRTSSLAVALAETLTLRFKSLLVILFTKKGTMVKSVTLHYTQTRLTSHVGIRDPPSPTADRA